MKKIITMFLPILLTVYFSACEFRTEQEHRPLSTEQLEKKRRVSKQEEQRARITANERDALFVKNGSVYMNKKVTAYLQSVMNRLYPKFKGRMKVKLLKFTQLNAISRANGSVYFNLGLIARLENEAQLATILGHEGAHFVYKHALKRRMKIRKIAQAGANKREIYGYSRNIEREADRQAFIRLKKAGYDTAEASKSFEHLLADVNLLKGHKPGLSRLHPKLVERINSFKRLHAKSGNKNGSKNTSIYNKKMRQIKVADLEENLAASNYKSVILILNNPSMNKFYPKYYPYFLGEAYRLRGKPNDGGKAENSYLRSTRNSPQFAPAYNSLGVYYLKQVKLNLARKYFKQYLKLKPRGKHAAYANHYIISIDKKIHSGH